MQAASAVVREQSAKSRADWAAAHPALARAEARLGAEQRKAERDFGHKVHGTTETHARAARTRQGAIARLYQGGHVTIDQLGAAMELVAAHEGIGVSLGIRTVSLETRVDTSKRADSQFYEALGAVRREVTFSRWRSELVERHGPKALTLARLVAIEDVALRSAAQRVRMRDAGARELLRHALNLWNAIGRDVHKEIDPAILAAAQAAIL